MNILEENERLKNENEQLQKSLTVANQVITESTKRDNCSVDKVKYSDSLMKLYTGLDNYDLFEWIYNQVKEKVPFCQEVPILQGTRFTQTQEVSDGQK